MQYRGPEEDEGNFDVSFSRPFDVTPLSRSKDGFADPINPRGDGTREAAARHKDEACFTSDHGKLKHLSPEHSSSSLA
ncbi:hypothetical protein Q8A67_015025 [Cirrhinus molitorella]|uniref:Uncharacterized protein n=1 Tax=Cirrhinus molitorella TaxID=172907 RepID=A0AA88PHN2_9TELE|nr:hypothetical protein Q8A67_015025 [Cirrhinus molitorella]